MSAKERPLEQVPGFNTVQKILSSIDRDVTMVKAAYDFDPPGREVYLPNFSGHGRKGCAGLPYDLLKDVKPTRNPREANTLGNYISSSLQLCRKLSRK